MSTGIKDVGNFIDEKEFEAAKVEATQSEYTYVHKFKQPFEYQGKIYKELIFDWDKLTGKDGLAIENELQILGKTVIVPQFSGEYLIRFAARACNEPIGSDAFEQMRIVDYNKIRSAARSFLLKSEL